MNTIGVIAIIIIVFIVWGTYEYTTAQLLRSPERAARHPRYKARWKLLAYIIANSLLLSAQTSYGFIAVAGTAAALGIAYIAFRHLLFRNPSMQRMFLTHSLPSNAPNQNGNA